MSIALTSRMEDSKRLKDDRKSYNSFDQEYDLECVLKKRRGPDERLYV